MKDTSPERLLESIRRVAAGAIVLGDGLVDKVVDELVRLSPETGTTPLPTLTAREEDVLSLVCEGLTNRQIGRRLGVGEATVKTYVSRLLSAFGTESRVHLAVTAITSRAVDQSGWREARRAGPSQM